MEEGAIPTEGAERPVPLGSHRAALPGRNRTRACPPMQPGRAASGHTVDAVDRDNAFHRF